MQLTNQQLLPASQAAAWAALNDIEVLKACIPGCESLSAGAPDEYEVLVLAAVGPVKARFKGRLRLSDLQPPHSYTLRFDGQGGAAGHGKGSAQVRLEPRGSDETVLHYAATASVGGKIAQIGSRLVDMAAQRMATEFFTAFTQELQARAQPMAPAQPDMVHEPPKTRGFFVRLLALFRRLLPG